MVEPLGIFGWGISEKISEIMKPLLKGGVYAKSASPKVVDNLLPYYDRWIKTSRKIPLYTGPWQGDATAKNAATVISTQSGFPYPVADAFLYALFTNAKAGAISESRLDPSLKKPMPIDPKKLIYSGIFLGSIIGLAWLTGNISKIVRG